MHRIGRDGPAVVERPESRDDGRSADELAAALLGLEEAHQSVDAHEHQHEVQDVERHAREARRLGGRIVAGEEGHRRAVLVEGHPEEDHHGEDEHEGRDARLGLRRRQLDLRGGARSGLLLCRHVGVPEGLAEGDVDHIGDDQRDARHGETHVIGRREFLDVVRREAPQIGDVAADRYGQPLQLGQRLGGHRSPFGKVLVREGRNLAVVRQSVLREEVVRDPRGHRRGEHGTDVDGHIEYGEGAVALGRIGRIVVQIAHHHLQVALEKARAAGDQRQCQEHERLRREARTGGYRKQRVAAEHDDDAERHHPAEAEPVGQDAAEEGHEIDGGQEDAVNLGGHGLRVAEFRLQEQGEDRKHGIVAETLARVGQRKGVQTFGLSFEHNRFRGLIKFGDKDRKIFHIFV